MTALPTVANFGRLARVYRGLEFAAFGRTLEQVRYCFLPELRSARSILILGEGDGRFVARLCIVAPQARIECIDASPTMIEVATQRLPSEARNRVTFQLSDIRSLSLLPARYDAVVTLFVLDCFTDAELPLLVERVSAALTPDAVWLFGDFAVPRFGFARWRAQVWLWTLYSFFQWQTGLQVRKLPDMERALCRGGWNCCAERRFEVGLLRAALYRRSRPA